MKKNYLFGLLSLFTLLFAASCQEEDVFGGASMADTEEVTFTVNTQQVATRADLAGKGNVANKLYYGVYEATAVDADGNGTAWQLISALSALTDDYKTDNNITLCAVPADISSNNVEVKIKLAKQKLYSVIFWAQSDAPMCTVNWSDRTMTVKTDVVANTEDNDVFYGYEESVKLDGKISRIVNLYRPFAQLNIGTSIADFDDAATAKLEVAQSQVVVKGVPNKLDLATGRATGEVDQTYKFANIPDKGVYNFPVDANKYRYLALAYVLVDNDEDKKMLVDVDFACKEATGNDTYNRTFTAVPVQLNYRTNIYGNLLSGEGGFNVTLNPDMGENNENVDEDNTVRKNVATVAELQDAIDNATGLTVINFERDIDANTTRSSSAAVITIAQKKGVEIIINGAGYKYNGIFKVHSNSNRENNGPVTFTDINFETSEVFTDAKGDKSFDFIKAVDFGNSQRYSQNITVDGCTFTAVANSDAEKIAVGVRVNATQNLEIKNCTATNLHSLLQAQSCDMNIDVDKVTITNCKNGVSFGNTKYPTLTNSTINVDAYGVRAEPHKDRGDIELTIANNNITAEKPIIIRKVTTPKYSVILEGENTLTAGQLYAVVFTTGDDEAAFVAPAEENYSITGAEGLNVYPVEEGAPLNANSNEQLSQAIEAGASTINLGEGEYVIPSNSVTNGETLTIKGTELTVVNAQSLYMDNAGLAFEGVTIKVGLGYAAPDASDYAGIYSPNATFTKCHFVGGLRVGRNGAKFEECKFTLDASDYVYTYGNSVEFSNCIFDSKGKALIVYSDGNGMGKAPEVKVSNCKFYASQKGYAGAIKNQECAAVEIDNYGCGVNLTLTENTIGENFSGQWRIKSYYTGKNNTVTVNGTEYTSLALDGKTMTIDGDKNVTVVD